MIALIQRVNHASVFVNNENVGEINQGILAFVAVEQTDDINSVKKMIDKINQYRIFSDADGRMNLSLQDIKGDLLIVSQFTLLAQTDKGRRPSFTHNPPIEQSKALYDHAVTYAQTIVTNVAQGIFGADMKVFLENDGPVTFWLEV